MEFEKGREYQILLVDDDEEDYILTKLLLNESSFHLPDGGEVHFTLDWKSSYDEAVLAMEQDLYDAYLVDMHLRGHTGLDLLDFAKKLKLKAPIIILTGRESYEADLESTRAGASDYLVKGHINAQLLERSIRYSIERKQAEEKLRQSNEETTRLAKQLRQSNRQLAYANHRLYAVLQALPVGVVIADSEGRVTTKNDMADKIWGGAPQVRKVDGFGQYKGWWSDSGDPLGAEDWAIARAILRGEVSIGEVIDIVRFDKSHATILNSGAPILNDDGEIIGGVAVFQDITRQRVLERKAVEAARDEQRRAEELNAVLSSMNESVIVFNQDGLPHYANPEAVKELNLTSQLLSQNGASFNLYEYPDGEENLVHENLPWVRALRGEKVTEEHYLLKNLDGQYFSVMVSASPVELDGQPMGAVMVWRDLTEREQLMAQIAEERSRLNKVIATAPIAFLVTDDKGVIIFANPAAESLFGENLLWQDLKVFKDFRLSLPKDGKFSIENFPLFLSLNKGETHISYELVLQSSENEKFTLLMNSSPITSKSGRISGAVAIFQDITQHRLNEEESRRKALRIEVQHHLIQYQEKERLTIARDLHDGPLQDLIGIQYQVSRLINQIKGIPPDNQPSQEGLVESLSSIQLGLMSQIQEVRTFSSELRPPTLVAFGLEKALRAHAEKFNKKHPDLLIHLNLEPDGQRLGERMRLAFYRIYQELLSNIIRHSEASEVIVTFMLEKEKACLIVQDNGGGFKVPDDWIEVIRDGHMGLVGVKERAEAIRGTVEIKSSEKSGTTITITAPIQ
jgi:PAS domain S-box-containing protein